VSAIKPVQTGRGDWVVGTGAGVVVVTRVVRTVVAWTSVAVAVICGVVTVKVTVPMNPPVSEKLTS
jgi:hypothetical protein